MSPVLSVISTVIMSKVIKSIVVVSFSSEDLPNFHGLPHKKNIYVEKLCSN